MNIMLLKGIIVHDTNHVLPLVSDIAYSIPPEKIFSSLEDSYLACLSQGSKVLALTVPETHANSDKLVNRRHELNEKIMSYDMDNL